MQKPSLIIGKKQLVLSCLTVLLAAAVYINYTYTKNQDIPAVTPVTELEETPHYGDTEFVSAEADPSADYFAQARLEKTMNRDEAVQTLQTMIGGGDVTEDEAVTAALNATEVAEMIEHEGTIESLIKSQGFSDCVVYLDGNTAKVVVKTEGLDSGSAAMIKETILEEVTIPAENIRIFEVK